MCKSERLEQFLDLGFHPHSDGFMTEEQLNEPEVYYPLTVYLCYECSLVQLGYVVPAKDLYDERYVYESSITKTGRHHFLSLAKSTADRFKLEKDSLVIDVGSNVGVLLSGFKECGTRILGVDPAPIIAKIANANGIHTIPKPFTAELASTILLQKGRASVITATNVFAHIDDLHDFMDAVDMLLAERGVLIIEVPYLVNLIAELQYDTIYHQHLSYFSIKPLVMFFKKFGMRIFDVAQLTLHGGSIRVFVARAGKRKIRGIVQELLDLERRKYMYSMDTFNAFALCVKAQRRDLLYLLRGLKKQGNHIVGISAPAKGNTLLNYCKIDTDLVDYITEKAKIKVGRFTPGMHIPIYPDEKLMQDKPDYALLFAWNFAEEILQNMRDYSKQGGKVITPIPHPKIL